MRLPDLFNSGGKPSAPPMTNINRLPPSSSFEKSMSEKRSDDHCAPVGSRQITGALLPSTAARS
eukprot:CAMPEP_0118979292 /NCGR_PEP_ID=MMETSP1173-20130426/25637_1 /TAXON_ID=1034831 /ORGANISM="Rhizochromulina marina cf, Strain CCMP1243" /LENGTH=63 /DNA_ID=CAMNT_0006929549 /DNA_START=87 /DNA_END=275 /DNA_ORIENTATION=+